VADFQQVWVAGLSACIHWTKKNPLPP